MQFECETPYAHVNHGLSWWLMTRTALARLENHPRGKLLVSRVGLGYASTEGAKFPVPELVPTGTRTPAPHISHHHQSHIH